MTRFSTGHNSYEIHYSTYEMSRSKKILMARFTQLLTEKKCIGLILSKAFFVFICEHGENRGYEFRVPYVGGVGARAFTLSNNLNDYFKGNIDFAIKNNSLICKPLDVNQTICPCCKGKRFVCEDGLGYIKSCQTCNSKYFLPFALY